MTQELIERLFKRGDFVQKKGGSSWRGKIVGEYSTELTPRGYAVESLYEPGSVQIYPESALETLVPELQSQSARIAELDGLLREILEWREKGETRLIELQALMDGAYPQSPRAERLLRAQRQQRHSSHQRSLGANRLRNRSRLSHQGLNQWVG